MEIQPYGTMVAAGILISGAVGLWLSKRLNTDVNDMILLFAYGISFGFMGAKIAYLLLNINRIPWSEVGIMQVIEDGGFVFYGGIPTGAVGIYLARKIHKLELKTSLRICMPLLPLGHAFGRMGCALVGCCHGIAYNGVLAIRYRSSQIAPNGEGLFPVQLLEAALLVVLSAGLLRLLLHDASLKRLGLFYFVGYSVMRFFLEFLRGDLERGVSMGLSTSQWGSLIILLPGIIFYYRETKK